MPGFLLHEDATVQCAHSGPAKPEATSPRVKVAGKPVTTQPKPYTVSGCSFPPPPSGNGPCLTAQWTTGARRVRAGGEPVLLADGKATCAPTGTPLNVVATQTRVRGA